MPASEAVVHGYLSAKKLVLDAGYESDISWAEELGSVQPDARYVLCEGAWVIVNSGFRYAVARKLWPRLRAVFHEFEPALVNESCLAPALLILGHQKKMRAILDLADIVRTEGVARILEEAKDPQRLTRLPFIGKITCYHFAKVLGADVVKPDVHLTRAALSAGRPSPQVLCQEISHATGDRLTVVDTVLWRYGEQQKAKGWLPWDALYNESVPG